MPEPKVRPRCPKCRKPPARYIEEWSGFSMTFEATAGVPESKGNLREGVPSGVVRAECECGHGWRVRGARQVTHLAGYA